MSLPGGYEWLDESNASSHLLAYCFMDVNGAIMEERFTPFCPNMIDFSFEKKSPYLTGWINWSLTSQSKQRLHLNIQTDSIKQTDDILSFISSKPAIQTITTQ